MKARFKNSKNPFWTRKISKKNEKITVTKCKYRLQLDHFESFTRNDFKDIEVTGIAYCHPDDNFSEEFGKRLADSRAKKLAYRNVINQFEEKKHLLQKQLRELDRGINRHKKLLKAEQEHYSTLLNNSNND